MGEPEHDRLVAWAQEMQRVHARLRAALVIARETGTVPGEGADLLLYCWGFCAALSGHHRAEDDVLFPAVLLSRTDRPGLTAVLYRLRQDHSMIEHLLHGLRHAVRADCGPTVLARHLDGLEAVMESHFRYEERELFGVLGALRLDATPEQGLGPLA